MLCCDTKEVRDALSTIGVHTVPMILYASDGALETYNVPNMYEWFKNQITSDSSLNSAPANPAPPVASVGVLESLPTVPTVSSDSSKSSSSSNSGMSTASIAREIEKMRAETDQMLFAKK